MKKSLLLSCLITALALPTSFAVVSASSALETAAASSSYKASSLPKTIDLNDVSDADVRAYYQSLNGKNLSGNDLLKALKPILKNGQQYHSYDSGNAIWQMYEITDRDWTLSPAEEITNGTYNAETKTITGYSYGSMSDPKDNPYLHLLYRNHDEPASNIHAWDHHGDNKGIDREHIWPKSRGFGVKDGSEVKVPGARGDIHHLLPGDSYVNSSSHSNNAYGFVDMTKVTDNAGEKYKIDGKTVVAGNYRGTSLTFGKTLGTQEVFEPQDCDKGDIARACFYMVARYNNLAGDDDTIDAGNPNLFLEDTVDNATIYSTPDKAVSIGILRDLLAWHKLDPVDEYERHRNDIIYRNYAKNRNPFVDFPTWVDAIWGDVTLADDHRTITGRNANPIGHADPTSDPLYEADNYTIVSIDVQPSMTTYFVQEDFAFEGKILGTTDDAQVKDITAKCTFENTEFSSTGAKTITVKYKDMATATFDVDVVQPISITLQNQKKAFNVGDEFSYGGKVLAKAENGITKDLVKQCAFSGYDLSKEGKQQVTVTHTPSGLTANYEIEVTKKESLAPFGLSWPLFIGICIGAGFIVLLILVLLIVFGGKKGRRTARRIVTGGGNKPKKGGRKSTKPRKK